MQALQKIHHVAIIGSDYERTKHFYVNLLGFEVIRENRRAQDTRMKKRQGYGT